MPGTRKWSKTVRIHRRATDGNAWAKSLKISAASESAAMENFPQRALHLQYIVSELAIRDEAALGRVDYLGYHVR